MYIPEGWYHATQTLTSSSFSLRYSPPDELPGEYLYYLTRGNEKSSIGDYAAAVKLYRLGLAMQKDNSLLLGLGRSLEEMELYAEAEMAFKEAVEWFPFNAMNYVQLMNLFVSHSTKDHSDELNTLLSRADTFGLKATVLSLLQDAF